MGRHSRKGPAPKAAPKPVDTSATSAGASVGTGRRRRSASAVPQPGHPPPEQHMGAAAYGAPPVRGGHPEQHETGGGWGVPPTVPQGAAQAGRPGGPRHVPGGYTATTTGQHPMAPPMGAGARVPGPRREFVEAFDTSDASDASGAVPEVPGQRRSGHRRSGARESEPGESEAPDEAPAKAIKGRTLTGIAAAAVTTVLAVVIAGQVTDTDEDRAPSRAAGEPDRGSQDDASRSEVRPAPPQAKPQAPARPATYTQLMARQFPLDPELTASGDFTTVPGFDKAPGKGEKIRYRIDVEKGLPLDAKLFAEAVHKTLNDDRSWAHGGAMSFERISSGEPKFVITLASPGTTATWCAKSGLDTTVDNVSCDSAATQRVMINAFRWAQGAETYGPAAMFAYRQMLINHEVGHRLGHGHVNCRTPGALAPVMQQQTKSLDLDGVECRPNPWVHPGD
ncbi:DUF3152 domain-containing protein [Streptomyces sp. NPDC000410]|uniref:DUF3152 domain-containing protein n=1 Tax=Streptomyces sp. NPDC000410 TaxID=3154254 RepID=UPI003316A911